jgi:dienelactone hydrolase
MVVFAHGSGTTRRDPVNRFVARCLAHAGFGTLLMDLLEERESHDRHNVFDVDMQAARLVEVAQWLAREPRTRALGLGYFGTGVGTGVALMAAAKAPEGVAAIVSRGGRPDTALHCIPLVKAPTLFIQEEDGLGWVEAAYRAATAEKELVYVPSAAHRYREPGALEALARHAERWFSRYLTRK